jgi:hypothetical protein
MTIQTMKKTMEQMLQNEGYYLKVSIKKDGYHLTTDAVSHADSISLYYINSHTPGEVVFMAKTFFDKLNGK